MRYFIAYALGDGERDAVQALRQELRTKFGVQAALRLPPHVTLFEPFDHPNAALLIPALAAVAESMEPWPIATPSYGSFRQDVWFLDLEQDRMLFRLKKRVQEAVKLTLGIEERPKHANTYFHITLAYKDVTLELFRKIGAYLHSRKLPTKRVVVDSFSLFEHRGGEWREVRCFPLGTSSENPVSMVDKEAIFG
jgi:2'-5' RNA ligase